ncbi:MAG: hypothetical protein IJ996_05815 [Clostridia bacterium]|nr:hypothetical protein [Clostridia bacterium]
MKIKFWLCCLLAVMCCTFTGCKGFKYYSTNEEDYTRYVEEVSDAKFHMPQLTDLGEYESIVITRHKPRDMFFNTTDSVALFVTYSAEQFDGAMTGIQQNYEYLTETDETMQDIYAEINGYHISVVKKEINWKFDTGRYVYAYNFLMIGYNEDAKSIVYMFHYDHALGFITDLDKFIREGYYFPSIV